MPPIEVLRGRFPPAVAIHVVRLACERPAPLEGIPIVLGHALYMKAIQGGKARNDKVDGHKIAAPLRGGMLPQAYVYPAEMRATRHLLRRRTHLMRKRAELLAPVQRTTSQYTLPELGKKIADKAHRHGAAARVADPAVPNSLAVD
jgi:hypothetical protein